MADDLAATAADVPAVAPASSGVARCLYVGASAAVLSSLFVQFHGSDPRWGLWPLWAGSAVALVWWALVAQTRPGVPWRLPVAAGLLALGCTVAAAVSPAAPVVWRVAPLVWRVAPPAVAFAVFAWSLGGFLVRGLPLLDRVVRRLVGTATLGTAVAVLASGAVGWPVAAPAAGAVGVAVAITLLAASSVALLGTDAAGEGAAASTGLALVVLGVAAMIGGGPWGAAVLFALGGAAYAVGLVGGFTGEEGAEFPAAWGVLELGFGVRCVGGSGAGLACALFAAAVAGLVWSLHLALDEEEVPTGVGVGGFALMTTALGIEVLDPGNLLVVVAEVAGILLLFLGFGVGTWLDHRSARRGAQRP